MKITQLISSPALFAIALTLTACERDHGHDHAASDGTHTHADGSTHHSHGDGDSGHSHDSDGHGQDDDHGHSHEGMDHDHDHSHEEVPLPPATIGDMIVELGQSHGGIAPGKESHLVVKLPYSDNGSTIVRAWIGTEDRTLSYVGKGEYAPSHDDYDIHATAPDPLPANAMWWIEVEKPDGTKITGSTNPIRE